jgi:hypothetical protein
MKTYLRGLVFGGTLGFYFSDVLMGFGPTRLPYAFFASARALDIGMSNALNHFSNIGSIVQCCIKLAMTLAVQDISTLRSVL